jgi:hypothetical protein
MFQKPSNHIWYQLSWIDNQSVQTLGLTDIDVRVRTGDTLPYLSPITKKRYTLDQINNQIKNSDPKDIDQLLYHWQLSRATLGSDAGGDASMDDSSRVFFELGTTANSAVLTAEDDPVWNFWSLPHIHNISYISNNLSHDYLQLRIDLKSLDLISKVEMYKITLSSILKKDADNT